MSVDGVHNVNQVMNSNILDTDKLKLFLQTMNYQDFSTIEEDNMTMNHKTYPYESIFWTAILKIYIQDKY